MDTKQPYSSEEEQRELLRQLSESPEEQPRRSVHKSRAAESVSSDAEHGAEGDKAAMGAAKAADEAAEPKSNRKRWTYTIVNYVFKVLTGEIIIVKEVKRFYNYLAYIAVVLLVSIMVLFAALRQDNRRERLE